MELGIIEGFYGRPWSWPARTETIVALSRQGYRWHLYAPKADHALRSGWRNSLTADWLANVSAHQSACQQHGVSFGVGLSLQAFDRNSPADRSHLHARLRQLDELRIESIAVLFDDPIDRSATSPEEQSALVMEIAAASSAARLWVCPTWYADDGLLDQIYGARPHNYLSRLCQSLDSSIGVFWAGSKICADGYGPDELDRVAAQMHRLPTLWDNYPVNDGPLMSPYLHLSPAKARHPAVLNSRIAAHFVNPALQPVLTRIPAIALAQQYRGPVTTDPAVQFMGAACEVMDDVLARQLLRDLNDLETRGLPKLDEELADKNILREIYRSFEHLAAAEIVAWLDGYWTEPSLSVDTQLT